MDPYHYKFVQTQNVQHQEWNPKVNYELWVMMCNILMCVLGVKLIQDYNSKEKNIILGCDIVVT